MIFSYFTSILSSLKKKRAHKESQRLRNRYIYFVYRSISWHNKVILILNIFFKSRIFKEYPAPPPPCPPPITIFWSKPTHLWKTEYCKYVPSSDFLSDYPFKCNQRSCSIINSAVSMTPRIAWLSHFPFFSETVKLSEVKIEFTKYWLLCSAVRRGLSFALHNTQSRTALWLGCIVQETTWGWYMHAAYLVLTPCI